MTVPLPRFNIILAAFLLVVLSGCKTTEEKIAKDAATNMRFHVETNPDGTRYNFPVMVYRANPIKIQVEAEAAMDEEHMDKAEVVSADEFGGYAIKITFSERGRQFLTRVTSTHKGKRLAVLARWTEMRTLAAPVINKTITDGVFVFTPDATREEAERIVLGLNNVIKELKKPYVF